MSRAGKVAAPFVRQPGPRKKLTHFLSLRLLLPAGIPYSPPAADSWSPVSLASVASTLTPGSREADTALLVAHAQQRAVLRMAGTQDPEAPAHASRLADALRGLLVPPATLHLTLGLMDLAAPERLSLAQQTLRDLAPRMRHIVQASELPVQLGAIDVFSRPGDTPIPSQASVVFSSVPRPTNEPLFTLTELLVDTFVQAGLMDASFRKFHVRAASCMYAHLPMPRGGPCP
ncbi:hypothetical protein, variant [Fonticula alba]|uniref:A-kinase anchor protein 7-like phosphoesterase domain-containing protein n=1 Tax=Fonticula alba TaxID=691883 RepID=A0A058Z107_FONAL|nr:hypothetical protein, variant [Fonticula alba]KCV67935.1 hypothetical protein, variant [Fonticula alba]|eukprot:XP_009497755.1 hypothetical protein, variant [Fonticula alba]